MRRTVLYPASQRGAALVSVIFLIIVIAILGTVVIRTASDQQQVATLTLLEVKANAAAFSGLEYAANRLKNGAFGCPTPPGAGVAVPLPPAVPQTNGITVRLRCSGPMGTGVPGEDVYEIIATATHRAFGSLDYVQRVRTRRVSSDSW